MARNRKFVILELSEDFIIEELERYGYDTTEHNIKEFATAYRDFYTEDDNMAEQYNDYFEEHLDQYALD